MKKIIFLFMMMFIIVSVSGQNTYKYIINANGGINAASPVTLPSPFTLGATSVTTTGAQLNYSNTLTGNIQTQLGTKMAIADSGVYDGGYASMTNVNVQIGDTMDAYRTSAIPLKTSTILGQITKVTIGWDGATGCDFVWTGDAGHAAQHLDLGAVVPAKARVIAIEMVCTEALVGCTDITLAAGNASGGSQFIAAISCDDLNEVCGVIDASIIDGVIMNWASATHIWIDGDPSDNNWSDMTAGKWTIYITYIEYTDI